MEKLDSTKIKKLWWDFLGALCYVRDRLNPWSGEVPHTAGRLSPSTEPVRLEPAPWREKPWQRQACAPQADHGHARAPEKTRPARRTQHSQVRKTSVNSDLKNYLLCIKRYNAYSKTAAHRTGKRLANRVSEEGLTPSLHRDR